MHDWRCEMEHANDGLPVLRNVLSERHNREAGQWVQDSAVTLMFLMSHVHSDYLMDVPSQWETTLQCNVVSHWRGAPTERSLCSWCVLFLNLSHSILQKHDEVNFITHLQNCIDYRYIFIFLLQNSICKVLVAYWFEIIFLSVTRINYQQLKRVL